jgi:hypothetical protein
MSKPKGKHRPVQRKEGRRDLPVEHQVEFEKPVEKKKKCK